MKNIIITGGELFNKGAQAMVFVTVDELKKRFPDHEIYVLSELDLRRPKEELEQYAFWFTGWYPIKFARAQNSILLRLACLMKNGDEFKACEELYRNCDLMVDVSGFGFGQAFGPKQLERYADHLEFAKSFDIPMYLMPQSFGPFLFQEEKKAAAERIPELLKTVKLICAREQEGLDTLQETYGLKNVCLLPDLVLNNRGIDLLHIFREIKELSVPEIPSNCVGVVPNQRIVDALGKDAALKLYSDAIETVLENDLAVCVLSHASVDIPFCKKLKECFASDDRVLLLEQDFNCLEFNELVKSFQLLIASRFHALVHAYKNGVPCIAIGWAVKYQNLLKTFDQERFAFDMGMNPTKDNLAVAVKDLSQRREKESKRILARLQVIQESNVFDVLEIEKKV